MPETDKYRIILETDFAIKRTNSAEWYFEFIFGKEFCPGNQPEAKKETKSQIKKTVVDVAQWLRRSVSNLVGSTRVWVRIQSSEP